MVIAWCLSVGGASAASDASAAVMVQDVGAGCWLMVLVVAVAAWGGMEGVLGDGLPSWRMCIPQAGRWAGRMNEWMAVHCRFGLLCLPDIRMGNCSLDGTYH